MCRNIRVLFHFEPPTTHDEIRAAALQYVRKVSGVQKPSVADTAAFERAVDAVAASTQALLGSLAPRGEARTREKEKEKAKQKWALRATRMRAG
jgi:hypothetical protein